VATISPAIKHKKITIYHRMCLWVPAPAILLWTLYSGTNGPQYPCQGSEHFLLFQSFESLSTSLLHYGNHSTSAVSHTASSHWCLTLSFCAAKILYCVFWQERKGKAMANKRKKEKWGQANTKGKQFLHKIKVTKKFPLQIHTFSEVQDPLVIL
jgi:hypothetical protein